MSMVFLLAVAAAVLFATWLDGPGKTVSRHMDDGWSYLRDGVFQPLPQLPYTLELSDETLVLRHDLTEKELDPDYTLTLRSRYASVRVWADDVLVYEAAQGQEHALGSMWHFIPMIRCAGASVLTVMPNSPSSSARQRVNACIPAFETA